MSKELDHFFQCVTIPAGWAYQVALVRWPHPHEPVLEWITYRRWKTQPDQARLRKARAAALTQSRFFRACACCNRLTNGGHMHDHHTCQSCAERHLGVVY